MEKTLLLLLRGGSSVRFSIYVAQGDAALWLQQMAPNVSLVARIPNEGCLELVKGEVMWRGDLPHITLNLQQQ